jgi:hypothetical protein
MNLTQRPPRSARVRLGGFVLLPRMLDKCRAELAGTAGAFHYNCPLDRRFFDFTGIDAEALKKEVARGGGDGEILAWVMAHLARPLADYEIAQWSAHREAAGPADNESREFVNEWMTENHAAEREDITSIFAALDVDDHVTFGGKA